MSKSLDELRELLTALHDGGHKAAADAMRRLTAASKDDLLALERIVLDERDEALLKSAALHARIAAVYIAAGVAVPIDLRSEFTIATGTAGPSAERIVAGLLLLQHAHERVPVNEGAVMRSLAPLTPKPDFDNYRDVFAGAIGLLRTAAYYTLDARDCHDALASEPPEQETFPPLPFQRVWIEAHLPGQQRPTAYLRYGDPDGRTLGGELEVLGVGIVEVERSRTWDLYIAFRLRDDDSSFFLASRITPQAIVSGSVDDDVTQLAFPHIRGMAVGGAHLLTAQNVPHERILLPRHQRKRLQRAIPTLPHIYYVNLAAAGERDERETGRQYTVRWLVRGHWRHMDSGKTLCTCHQPPRVATWIEPYVKGPVGAPWKGRPVHRAIRPLAEASA